jgi:hypothetical protein
MCQVRSISYTEVREASFHRDSELFEPLAIAGISAAQRIARCAALSQIAATDVTSGSYSTKVQTSSLPPPPVPA